MAANSQRSTKKKMELAARRLEVGRLYLAGISQTEIGNRLGVSQPVISADLKVLWAEWLKEAVEDVKKAKFNELLVISRIENEAWEAWERSKGTRVKRTTTTKPSNVVDGEPIIETVVMRERMAGDPRFLDKVAWCVEQRCKILGVYAPTKLAGPDEGPIPIVIVKMPVDRL